MLHILGIRRVDTKNHVFLDCHCLGPIDGDYHETEYGLIGSGFSETLGMKHGETLKHPVLTYGFFGSHPLQKSCFFAEKPH